MVMEYQIHELLEIKFGLGLGLGLRLDIQVSQKNIPL